MEHRREDILPQPGGLTPGRKSSDSEVSVGRRRLPTPPTSVHSRPIPHSITLEELHAFRERIANTRLGNSISAMAKANSSRMRGALGMTRHTYNPLPEPIADSVDRNVVDNDIMTHRGQLRARVGDVVTFYMCNPAYIHHVSNLYSLKHLSKSFSIYFLPTVSLQIHMS